MRLPVGAGAVGHAHAVDGCAACAAEAGYDARGTVAGDVGGVEQVGAIAGGRGRPDQAAVAIELHGQAADPAFAGVLDAVAVGVAPDAVADLQRLGRAERYQAAEAVGAVKADRLTRAVEDAVAAGGDRRGVRVPFDPAVAGSVVGLDRAVGGHRHVGAAGKLDGAAPGGLFA